MGADMSHLPGPPPPRTTDNQGREAAWQLINVKERGSAEIPGAASAADLPEDGPSAASAAPADEAAEDEVSAVMKQAITHAQKDRPCPTRGAPRPPKTWPALIQDSTGP